MEKNTQIAPNFPEKLPKIFKKNSVHFLKIAKNIFKKMAKNLKNWGEILLKKKGKNLIQKTKM